MFTYYRIINKNFEKLKSISQLFLPKQPAQFLKKIYYFAILKCLWQNIHEIQNSCSNTRAQYKSSKC